MLTTAALIHNEIPEFSWERPSEYHSDAFTTKPLESLAVKWKTNCGVMTGSLKCALRELESD